MNALNLNLRNAMQRNPSMLLIATGLLWSMGGVFVKMSGATPLAFISLRGGVAALVFFLALRGKPNLTFSVPQIVGTIAYALNALCFVYSTTLTTAANAILLQYASPIWVAILSWLVLREKLRRFDVIVIAFILFGMWILTGGEFTSGARAGNLLAVLGGICTAILLISLRLQKDGSAYETIFLGNILAFVIGLPTMIANMPNLTEAAPIVFLGIFQIAIPYLLYTAATRRARAIDVAIIPSIEPVLSPIWVFLAVGEAPGARTLIGGAILLAAVAAKALTAFRAERTEKETAANT